MRRLIRWSPLGFLLTSTAAAAQDAPTQGAPAEGPPVPMEEAPAPRTFGAELSGGYGAGALLGTWPTPGVGGFVWIEAGLFPSAAPGPRVGAALWTEIGLYPLQSASETYNEGTTAVPFRPQAYGLSVAMRGDPSTRWSGMFDLGFGRLDLSNYYCAPPSTSASDDCGPTTVPLFDLRAGVRRSLGPIYVEGAVRGDWGASRNPEAYGLTDWWKVAGEIGVGVRVKK